MKADKVPHRLYRFMYLGGECIMNTNEIVRDIYLDLYLNKDTKQSEIKNLIEAYLLIKKYSVDEISIISEIKFLYLLELIYDKLYVLESISPAEDLYAQLDYIFPDSYRYNLPFVVKFYHTYKDKKSFNSIKFK